VPAPSVVLFSWVHTVEMQLACTSILLLALCSIALADFPFKKKPQEFFTHKPEDVAKTLRNGTPVQVNDLATELGIFAPVPASSAAKPNSPCVNFTHVEEKPVVLRAGAENVVLLADSSECDSTYILVFDKAPKSEWRHVQTVRLSAHRQPPEISFVELIEPGVFEIAVHHEITLDSGSAQQENFVLLKLLGDKVEVVLDTTEHSQITLANRVPDESDDLQQTQMSTFSLLKSPPKSAAVYRIVEKEVITGNKITITRSRLWSWNPELQRFRSVPFDSGDVRPAPSKKPAPKTKPVEPPPKLDSK